MKTQHIIVMVLATVATIYIGTGVITRSAGLAGRIGRLVDQASAEAPQSEDNLTQLLSDLASAQAEKREQAAESERDPMVPKSSQRKTTTSSSTQSEPVRPAVPSIAVTAVIIDENPMAVLATGGRSITVEEGDTVNGGLVVEIRSDGVVIKYEDKSRTYPYPSGT